MQLNLGKNFYLYGILLIGKSIPHVQSQFLFATKKMPTPKGILQQKTSYVIKRLYGLGKTNRKDAGDAGKYLYSLRSPCLCG